MFGKVRLVFCECKERGNVCYLVCKVRRCVCVCVCKRGQIHTHTHTCHHNILTIILDSLPSLHTRCSPPPNSHLHIYAYWCHTHYNSQSEKQTNSKKKQEKQEKQVNMKLPQLLSVKTSSFCLTSAKLMYIIIFPLFIR